MEHRKIYEDIALRTEGDIYIGVVGPVRTGKSTFIKRFMEALVIPNIENVYRRERARDELPQSGSGRTIMTAEPKFVPEEAVEIAMEDGAAFSVRLIDCVGYMVPGAVGSLEDAAPRMVTTPWFDHEIPMSEAAEIGTRKVIAEHSTIGIVLTTDGTITDIPREDYLEAEERVITELKELGKPFLVVLNALPKTALGPVFIVWMGAGPGSIIAMTLAISLIVTILEMHNGFLSTDPQKIRLMRTLGATRRQILLKLVLPANFTTMINALKVNVGLSWVGVIMGEFLVSRAGLGYLIVYGSQVFQMDLVMATVLLLAAAAALMYWCILWLEKVLKKYMGVTV